MCRREKWGVWKGTITAFVATISTTSTYPNTQRFENPVASAMIDVKKASNSNAPKWNERISSGKTIATAQKKTPRNINIYLHINMYASKLYRFCSCAMRLKCCCCYMTATIVAFKSFAIHFSLLRLLVIWDYYRLSLSFSFSLSLSLWLFCVVGVCYFFSSSVFSDSRD